ncbi:MAG: methyl-accepting chemotaxis protein [Castellaniella sp.]|uniref:methyl-accepting chemotaxis protein n=1 Tax=Castellaniella sp. TaxID=1955812 RepID=UPI003C78E93B
MFLPSLSRLGVAARLTLGFLAVALIALCIGGIGLYASQRLNTLAESMYNRDLHGLQITAQANQQLLLTARAIRIAALAPTREIRNTQLSAVNTHLQALDRELSRATSVDTNQDGQTLLLGTIEASRRYASGIRQVADLISREALPAVRPSVSMLYQEIVPLANQIETSMERLIQHRQEQALALSQETRTIYGQTLFLIISLTLAGALCAFVLGIVLARGLMRQLGSEPAEVMQIAQTIAAGDLSQTIDTRRAPRHSILDAMAHMQQALEGIVTEVRVSSDHIATGSQQIQLGNTDLAQRTERQACDIAEAAAAVEEITGTMQNNAAATRDATTLTAQADAAVSRSLSQVQEIERILSRQEENSRAIEGITSLIEGISFQTNILALNAAVEAVHAGTHGQGFSVVAAQVQELARRSSDAAKEIATLIDGNTRYAALIAQSIQQTAADIRLSGEQIGQLNQSVAQIQASTEEQAAGLRQINTTIGQLSDITQDNAALVEESAAASRSLARQAHTLVTTVGSFQLRSVKADALPTLLRA